MVLIQPQQSQTPTSAAWESKQRPASHGPAVSPIPVTSSCCLIFLPPPKDPCSYRPECPQVTAVKSWYSALVKRSTASHPKPHPEQLSWTPAASWPPSLLGPVVHNRLQGGNLRTGQEAGVSGSSLKWPSGFGRRDLAVSAPGTCPEYRHFS